MFRINPLSIPLADRRMIVVAFNEVKHVEHVSRAAPHF